MGPPAARELCPISKTITTKLSAYSVISSEWSERAVDKAVCVRLRGSAVEGFNEFNELTNSLIP